MSSYLSEAMSDASETVLNFIDQIVDDLRHNGEASDDLLHDYSYGDSYHHENHVDRAYQLTEAAEILDELDRYVETDKGLWEGLSPREAISCQAAYTYGNAVYTCWSDLIELINEDDEIQELVETGEAFDADTEPEEDVLPEIKFTEAGQPWPTTEAELSDALEARIRALCLEYES